MSRSRRKASELVHSVDGDLTARENVLVFRASGQMGSHANERLKVHALAPEAGTAPISSAESSLGGKDCVGLVEPVNSGQRERNVRE